MGALQHTHVPFAATTSAQPAHVTKWPHGINTRFRILLTHSMHCSFSRRTEAFIVSTASSSSAISIISREFPLRFEKENDVNDVFCTRSGITGAVSRKMGMRVIRCCNIRIGFCFRGILGGLSGGVVGRGDCSVGFSSWIHVSPPKNWLALRFREERRGGVVVRFI